MFRCPLQAALKILSHIKSYEFLKKPQKLKDNYRCIAPIRKCFIFGGGPKQIVAYKIWIINPRPETLNQKPLSQTPI